MYVYTCTCFAEGRSVLVAMKIHGNTFETEESTTFCERKGGEVESEGVRE